MNPEHKIKKIIVVANDAGGGEILAAYIKTNPSLDFIPYAAGPAARIFEREGIDYKPAAVETAKQNLFQHQDVDLVLTGTGWMTPIERLFIIEAKKLGLKTAAFLDHWVNYRERFCYPEPGWQHNLPDEIWVGDAAAEKLAKNYFSGKTIRFIPNPYFTSFARRYQKLLESGEEGKGLLFIGEPTSYVQIVLEQLLDYLVDKQFTNPVILRPHPAEGPDRYDDILDKYSGKLRVSISNNRNIIDEFLISRVVVGMESAALVLALFCAKPTLSFISDPKTFCPLPFADLIKIKTPEELTILDQYLF